MLLVPSPECTGIFSLLQMESADNYPLSFPSCSSVGAERKGNQNRWAQCKRLIIAGGQNKNKAKKGHKQFDLKKKKF